MSDKYLPNIGALAEDAAQRDAIHIAVAPVVAAEVLYPGQDAGAAGTQASPVGIVDPYLKGRVLPGQRFWLFLYPNTITALRHEWTHPAFGASPTAGADRLLAEAREWITDFANEFDMTYDGIIRAAHAWLDDGKYVILSYDTPSRAYNDSKEFWEKFRIVSGRHAEHNEDSFFSCSC